MVKKTCPFCGTKTQRRWVPEWRVATLYECMKPDCAALFGSLPTLEDFRFLFKVRLGRCDCADKPKLQRADPIRPFSISVTTIHHGEAFVGRFHIKCNRLTEPTEVVALKESA